jgi:riboflavin-specific deaminase-like protein
VPGDLPYIHINCASTIDGKIALPDGGRLEISTQWDKTRVHRLRSELGSVLVGAGTIIADDPKLTVNPDRAGGKKAITKIVLDGSGKISPSSRFLRTEGRSLIVTTGSCSKEWLASIEALEGIDLAIEVLPGGPAMDPKACFRRLGDRGIRGVLVEGGSDTIARIVVSGCFDLMTVFYGPIMIGGGGPTIAGGMGFPGGAIPLKLTSVQRPQGGGLLVEYAPIR